MLLMTQKEQQKHINSKVTIAQKQELHKLLSIPQSEKSKDERERIEIL